MKAKPKQELLDRIAKRLAYQLEVTTDEVIARATLAGLRGIDFNLSEECHAFDDGTHRDFDITAAMNRLTPARFSKLCDGDKPPQQTLVEAHLERGTAARQEAEGKVVPFLSKPWRAVNGPNETEAAGPITVEPFAVETRFVRVTVTMPKASAEFIASQSEYIQWQLGKDVELYAGMGDLHLNSETPGGGIEAALVRKEVESFGTPQWVKMASGSNGRPVTIEMVADRWESAQTVAKHIGVEPVHVIRTALHVSLRKLKHFNATRGCAGK